MSRLSILLLVGQDKWRWSMVALFLLLFGIAGIFVSSGLALFAEKLVEDEPLQDKFFWASHALALMSCFSIVLCLTYFLLFALKLFIALFS